MKQPKEPKRIQERPQLWATGDKMRILVPGRVSLYFGRGFSTDNWRWFRCCWDDRDPMFWRWNGLKTMKEKVQALKRYTNGRAFFVGYIE